MSNTDTNVVVTHYRAEFTGVAPFADRCAWRIESWSYRYTLPRRRRATVVAQWAAQASVTELARKRTSDGGAPLGHVHPSMLMDQDAVVTFVPDSPGSRFGTAVLVEQVAR